MFMCLAYDLTTALLASSLGEQPSSIGWILLKGWHPRGGETERRSQGYSDYLGASPMCLSDPSVPASLGKTGG